MFALGPSSPKRKPSRDHFGAPGVAAGEDHIQWAIRVDGTIPQVWFRWTPQKKTHILGWCHFSPLMAHCCSANFGWNRTAATNPEPDSDRGVHPVAQWI